MNNIGWLYLFAGVAISMVANPMIKMSNGFEKPLLGIAGMVLYLGTVVAWAFAVKHLPLGMAYVVWSGVGAVMLTIISIFLFGEQMTALKALFMVMIIAGCIGLKVIAK